jgi:hypothetical protein
MASLPTAANARHIHLRRAAQSAGEALAWYPDDAPANRSRSAFGRLAASMASAVGQLFSR